MSCHRFFVDFARAFLLAVIALLPTLAAAQSRICTDRDTIVFGDRPVGSTASTRVTIRNCGSAPFGFTDVSVHPATGPAFRVAASCATGAILQPAQSCTLDITFAPTTAGQQSGGVWLRNTTSTSTQLITFYGRGTDSAAGSSSLAFDPGVVQLGIVAVGATSDALTVAVQNRGAVPVTPSALVINGPGAYDFDVVGDCAVGKAIPAGGSCALRFLFTPAAAGARLANLIIDAPQLASLAILQVAGTGVAAAPAPPAVDIIEFHHAGLDHYFLTASADEADFIDRGGLGTQWTRTSRRLRGWSAGAQAPNAVDACRFFGTPGLGPDSHFYTVNGAECAAVKQDRYWEFEGVAFRVLPLAGSGCAPGGEVVERLYKPASDVTGIRHRYVIGDADVGAMLGAGWTLEGPVFCSVK